MTHEEIRELLGPYALDATDPMEREVVATHLAGCVHCRSEVDQLSQACTALVLASAPPRHIWAAISRETRRATGRGQPGQKRLNRAAPHRSAWIGRALAAAAVVAIAVLGVDIQRLHHRLDQSTAGQGSSVASAAQAARHESGARRIELISAHPAAPRPVAEVIATASGPAYFVNRSLRALPASKTYQLWALRRDRPISVGLLGADPSTVGIALSGPDATGTLVVTVEPASGSVTPTGGALAESGRH